MQLKCTDKTRIICFLLCITVDTRSLAEANCRLCFECLYTSRFFILISTGIVVLTPLPFFVSSPPLLLLLASPSANDDYQYCDTCGWLSVTVVLGAMYCVKSLILLSDASTKIERLISNLEVKRSPIKLRRIAEDRRVTMPTLRAWAYEYQ